MALDELIQHARSVRLRLFEWMGYFVYHGFECVIPFEIGEDGTWRRTNVFLDGGLSG
jgi:hypothetical protein